MPQAWQELSFQNKHPRDDSIVFDEPTHVYTVNGTSKGWISCTKFIHNVFPHFDADAIIAKMMASPKWPNNKYYGKTAKQIKDEWDANGRAASSQGTAMHLAIEQFYHLVPYRSEWEVWSEEYKLAGSIDMVFHKKSDDSYVIYDWKRSKEIKMDNSWENGHGPVEHLPNSNYWHYTLQLNTYRWFLETYYGLRISDMCIVIFHPDNTNYQLFRLNRLDSEIQDMLAARKATVMC